MFVSGGEGWLVCGNGFLVMIGRNCLLDMTCGFLRRSLTQVEIIRTIRLGWTAVQRDWWWSVGDDFNGDRCRFGAVLFRG
jgi:hypothetical protein